jgi:hypothetical protein
VISIIPAIAGGSGLEEINFTKEELQDTTDIS